MKNFSYIIPFNSTIDNINNLRKIIKWVNGWQGIEVIVVEYDSKSPKLDMISDPFIHIFVKNGVHNFSKSWAYNIGVKRSNSDVIICGDSSSITNPDNISKSIKLLNDYDMVKPFNKLIEVNISQLSDFGYMDKNIDSIQVGSDYRDDRIVDICNNITVFKRDSLLKLGGWEEKFMMDFEYIFQSYKVKKLCKWIELDAKGYTLPSGRAHNDVIISKDVNVINNLKSLNDNHLVNYLKSTYQTVANLSRYE